MSLLIPRRTFLAGTAATLISTDLARAAGAIRAAWIYDGPVGDVGRCYQHDRGRREVESVLGDKVKTVFSEKVAEGPDSERVIRQLADSSDIVFTTSLGFMDAAEQAAKHFAEVKFEQATGFKIAANLAEYNSRRYEGWAIAGTLAGLLSKKGVAGCVGSVPSPDVVVGINAFTLAARKSNPRFQTKVIWISSRFDPGKEAHAAKALIDQGADWLNQDTDSPAVMEIAEARGVLAVGQASNMKSFGPKAQVTSILDNWGPYYIARVKAVLDGSWKSQSVWMGLKDGAVEMAAYGIAVTPEAASAADKIKADIIAGTLHPFTGPIKNQKGQAKVADGKAIADDDLRKMDWYVEGVQA